jgi:hypothetical protein
VPIFWARGAESEIELKHERSTDGEAEEDADMLGVKHDTGALQVNARTYLLEEKR